MTNEFGEGDRETSDDESGAVTDDGSGAVSDDRIGAAPADPEVVDVLVVGSGIAGCAAALAAARSGAEVLVVTKASRPEGASTNWAQGGITTTRGDPTSLKRDILAASDGTADPAAVDVLVEDAERAVEDVLVDTVGVEFDRDGETFDYTREAAHSRERILHVDAETGTHILRPFLRHLDGREDVTIREDTAALELLTDEGAVHGVLTDESPGGKPVYAAATILATGGIGSLYPRSTNPAGSTGDGIALAALAGAAIADMEFVQFHPTGFDPTAVDGDHETSTDTEPIATATGSSTAGDESTFLLSEALRGKGAVLRNGDGERFMPEYHPDAELAPRDVVARAVASERERTGSVVLDVEPLDPPLAETFPTLARRCRDRGVDGSEIPVAPCQHFLCGGIAVDDRGRTDLDGLYAVGECARTGVHGANRLASTSLLEGLVWGLRAGEDTAAGVADDTIPDPTAVEPPTLRDSDPTLPPRFAAEKFTRLRATMAEAFGIERDPETMARAGGVLRRLKGEVDAYVRTRTSRELYELRNASVTALLIARAATENAESVGCHYLVADGAGEETVAGDQS